MNGLKFIKTELESKCYGNILVTYNPNTQKLVITIETDFCFAFKQIIEPTTLSDKQALAILVKSIKLSYIGFLLDFYFKNSD